MELTFYCNAALDSYIYFNSYDRTTVLGYGLICDWDPTLFMY